SRRASLGRFEATAHSELVRCRKWRRRGWIRFVELHISAAALAVIERSRREVIRIGEPNAKQVGDSRLTVVNEADAEHDRLGFGRVCPRQAADIADVRALHRSQVPRNLD